MIYEVEYEYNEGIVPDERSVNACQFHAEMDLWATRYKMAKAAHKLAESVVNEIEKWDYSVNHLNDAIEISVRWNKAVKKINAKYEAAKVAYEKKYTLNFVEK